MSRPPKLLLLAGGLVAALALLPVAYLIVRAVAAGPESWRHLMRPSMWRVLANSAALAAITTGGAIALGAPLAWLTVRTDLPMRRLWSVLAILPLAMPSYIATFAYIASLGPRGALANLLEPLGVERLPEIYGLPGAALVITLINYPFVVLTVRAALHRMDPALEEAAAGLGLGRRATLLRVTAPQLRPAIAAGGLLVALYALSDFGTPALMQYDVFTSAIYTQYRMFDKSGAAVTASLLVVLTLLILALETLTRGRGRYYHQGSGAARPPSRVRLGRWKPAAVAFCAATSMASLGLPIGVMCYWTARGLARGGGLTLAATPIANSILAATAAGLMAALAALPVVFLAVRYRGWAAQAIERSSYAANALPGIVVALALVFFSIRLVPALYLTLPVLVFAYTARFLPQAVACIRTSLLQVPPKLEEAARGLGRGRWGVFFSITAPLLAPGVLAAMALVFLTTIKELPLTLILSPPGFETLVTEIWTAATEGMFAEASPPALLLVGVSALSIAVILRQERRGAYG